VIPSSLRSGRQIPFVTFAREKEAEYGQTQRPSFKFSSA